MNASEIIAIVIPVLYTIASAIAAKYPKSKVGTVCAIIALATKHKVTPKAK